MSGDGRAELVAALRAAIQQQPTPQLRVAAAEIVIGCALDALTEDERALMWSGVCDGRHGAA